MSGVYAITIIHKLQKSINYNPEKFVLSSC